MPGFYPHAKNAKILKCAEVITYIANVTLANHIVRSVVG